jgi:elongation factor P--beta-lysine ligase
MSEDTRRTFKARTAAMTSIRNFMASHEFMEVETPMLHVIPAVQQPSLSSRITMRWTWKCTCVSHLNCI